MKKEKKIISFSFSNLSRIRPILTYSALISLFLQISKIAFYMLKKRSLKNFLHQLNLKKISRLNFIKKKRKEKKD